MKFNRILFLIFLQFIVADCNLSQKQSTSNNNVFFEDIEIDGINRKYYLFIPETKLLEEKKIPILFLLHGRFGSGKHMLEKYDMNQIAKREGFAVVYPDGYKRSWADGRGGTPADKDNIDDVKFLESILQKVSQKFRIDTSKVFIAGHSNGGFMTQRMLIEKSTLFRAGASVTAHIAKNILKKYSPTKAVSVAFLSGTEDPLVPYEGGYVEDGEEVLGAEDSVRRWAKWNNCNLLPSKKILNEKRDQTRLETYTYGECKDQTEVKLYKLVGAGHNWPGISQQIPFINLGKSTEELNASEEIWAFFKNHLYD